MAPKKEGWEDTFIRLLSESCNVSLSARGCGINRETAYRKRKKSKTFAKQWDAAKAEAVELLEAEAWARARKTSDTLMIFLLKANRPDKYRELLRHNVDGQLVVKVEYGDYNPKTS